MRTSRLIDAEYSAQIPDAHLADGESADDFGAGDVTASGEKLRKGVQGGVARDVVHDGFFGLFVNEVFHNTIITSFHLRKTAHF